MSRPSLLCPVDFSDASRGALRYAAMLAEHVRAPLTVLAVDDPFLTQAAAAAVGDRWLAKQTHDALDEFIRETLARPLTFATLRLATATGKPAEEILRAVGEAHHDLIVMSTHGATGLQKVVFGSTTERVLRETPVPVIVTPAQDPGPDSVAAWQRAVETILVPVDLSAASAGQVRVASGLAHALGSRLVIAHVLEPLRHRFGADHLMAQAETTRRSQVTHLLEELVHLVPPDLSVEMMMGHGQPADEIARLTAECRAGAVVVGLHASPDRNRRMGTVTYRLLCQAPVLVVAWPPGPQPFTFTPAANATAGART